MRASRGEAEAENSQKNNNEPTKPITRTPHKKKEVGVELDLSANCSAFVKKTCARCTLLRSGRQFEDHVPCVRLAKEVRVRRRRKRGMTGKGTEEAWTIKRRAHMEHWSKSVCEDEKGGRRMKPPHPRAGRCPGSSWWRLCPRRRSRQRSVHSSASGSSQASHQSSTFKERRRAL